jgi:hypothetical protein
MTKLSLRHENHIVQTVVTLTQAQTRPPPVSFFLDKIQGFRDTDDDPGELDGIDIRVDTNVAVTDHSPDDISIKFLAR